MARFREAWFDHLLRNKAVRTFLSNYAEQDWQEVTKLTLIYGIINLNFFDGKPVVPLEKLRDIVSDGAKAVTIENAIPGLNNKLEDLRLQLDEVAQDIQSSEPPRIKSLNQQHKEAINPVTSLPSSQIGDEQRADLAAANVALRHGEKWLRYKGRGLAVDPQDMPVRLLDRAAAAEVVQRALSPNGRPPSDWRTGDRGRTYSPPGKKRSPALPGDGSQGAKYPSWWGDGEDWRSGGGGGGRSRSAPRPGRPPPRLAYSVQLEPGVQPLWRNDLVTSRYLDVPSSGYGRAASPPPVPPQYLSPPPPPQQKQHEQQSAYGMAPEAHPACVASGLAAAAPTPPGVAGPFQDSYSPNGGGAGPQLYVVQPSGAVVPRNAVAAASWGQPPSQQQQQHSAAAQRPQRQPQQQSQRGLNAGRPLWKEASSRIREQVQADRAAACARRDARQRAVEAAVSAVAPPRPLLLQRPQEGRWSAATSGGGSAASPRSPGGGAIDVVDSLAANPFTAWFIEPRQDQKQAQQQQQSEPPLLPQRQQQSEAYLQRPPNPAVQQEQQQQHEQPSLRAWSAAPTLPPQQQATFAAGGGGNAAAEASLAFQPWPAIAGVAAAPRAGQAAAHFGPASLTFYPAVPSWDAQGQPRDGPGLVRAPTAAATASSPSASLSSFNNPYNVRQHGDPDMFQMRPRVAWADNPHAQSQSQGGPAPAWLSGPSLWEGPWNQQQNHHQQLQPRHQHQQQQQSYLQQQQQQQQQQQGSPSGQWLGPQGPWPGAPATSRNFSSAVAPAARGWADQAGWLPSGAWTGAAGRSDTDHSRQQLSPRAEALRVVRPEVVQLSKTWVGDFGHLEGPRFPPPKSLQNGASGSAAAGAVSHSGAGSGFVAPCSGSAAAHRDAAAGCRGGVAAASEGVGQQQPEQQRALSAAMTTADGLLAAAAQEPVPIRAPTEGAVIGAINGDGAETGGETAAEGVAQERAWNRVMGQVSRLGHVPELPRGSAVALGAGGVKWDFDKIMGSPSGLTYQ